MTKWKFFAILFVAAAVVGVPWWLISSAAAGSVVAGFVLGILLAATLVIIGYGLSQLQSKIQTQAESVRFQQNTRENLAMMQQTQRVANQLTAQSVQAANAVLPSPEVNQNGLVIDDAVFRFVDGDGN